MNPETDREPDAHDVQRMKQREPTQHDLLKLRQVPKEDLADSFEAFDGDEN